MAEDDDKNEPKQKASLKEFLVRLSAPFSLVTVGLGEITARRMTLGRRAVFETRAPHPDGITDIDLVRIYAGCVAARPSEDPDDISPPLTEEEVECLTDDDLRLFASDYLHHIFEVRSDKDPVAMLAALIRKEHKEWSDSSKRLKDSVATTMARAGATTEIMKNWPGLSSSVSDVGSLKERIDKMFGSSLAGYEAVGKTLRKLQEEQNSSVFQRLTRDSFSVLDKFNSDLASESVIKGIEPTQSRYENLHLPRLSDTPQGRTALSTEKMEAAVGRMEDGMGLVVAHAGEMSDVTAKLLQTLRNEAVESQKHARRAIGLAMLTLAVSAVALVFTAWYAVIGYGADRSEAGADESATASIIEALGEQNALLRAMHQEQSAANKLASDRADQQAKVSAEREVPPPKVADGQ
ncbi:hypothetical protein QFW77_14680 [Luteimonas sp. RD2P54]|uniref:Uncharacterized protein n=1 Tax=Luteimonas endophytica TaxID=3042023 RepID=A0ABT6JBT4_9GAMM|nr:hypothetical protein [Luteimonas endophytica]MDH5824224.1 hypothetical protein [Luteimonas endophytica]